MYDSVTNATTCLGNTTETFLRINNLLAQHNYTFSVRARCLLNGQLCGEPALLLYNDPGNDEGTALHSTALHRTAPHRTTSFVWSCDIAHTCLYSANNASGQLGYQLSIVFFPSPIFSDSVEVQSRWRSRSLLFLFVVRKMKALRLSLKMYWFAEISNLQNKKWVVGSFLSFFVLLPATQKDVSLLLVLKSSNRSFLLV